MTDQILKILIVEDDFLVKTEIKRILKTLGHFVIGEANDGEAGVKKAVELDPDVILMDIEMKKMNGIEAAAIIKEKKPTPIVFLTAHDSMDFLVKASKAGASSYLSKPPKGPELNRALVLALARHHDLMKLQTALDEIKTLRGIIPICSQCKKIRDDQGYWNLLETYLEKYSDACFSHSLCPDCSDELYCDEDWYIEMKNDKKL